MFFVDGMAGKEGKMTEGIGRIGIWFFLSCKRHLHKWSFLIILLLFPVGTLMIRGSEKETAAEIRIAICVEQEKVYEKETTRGLEQELVESLVNRSAGDGLFCFYQCENEQQVKEEVASRRAECGYVISAELQKQMDRKKFKRSIRVYSAPSTMAAQLSSEVVFAAMISLYDRKLFEQYTSEKLEAAGRSYSQENVRQLYDKWNENGSTFHFTYEMVDGKGQMVGKPMATSVFPVRGIVAVYLFVIGLYSAVIDLTDEKKHLFLAVPYGIRTGCRLAAMAAPVFLAGISGLAALRTGNVDWRGGYEWMVLAGYGIVVILFSRMVCLICRQEALIGSLIPFFLAGSLIFCPVFLDIGKYIPEFEMLERFFLPSYYLRMF